jgi:hypothetical protein
MTALGDMGRRLLAWAVVVIAALLLLKLVAGVFIGLVSAVVTIALLVVVGFAVLWALRHL